MTNTTQITIGTEVYRKSDFGKGRSFYGYLGTVERILTMRNGTKRAYARWHGAMHLFGGTVDSHSTIALSSLVLATPELAERLQEIKAEIKAQYQLHAAAQEAKRVEQFQNAQPGFYGHIKCPKIRKGTMSPATFQRFDKATGLHVFKCNSHVCQDEHLVSDHRGTVQAQREAA